MDVKTFDKVLDYLKRVGEADTTFLVADMDSDDMVLYSNKGLPGYDKEDGVYKRIVSFDSIKEGHKDVLKEYAGGFAITTYRAEMPDDASEEKKQINRNKDDLETYVLSLGEKSEHGLEKYCFIPTQDVALKLYESDKCIRALIHEQNWYKMPTDVGIVHEGLHGDVGFNNRHDLYTELLQRGFIDDETDYSIIGELFSKIGDVCYQEENYPDIVHLREETFSKEQENVTARDEKEKDTTHGEASRLYFQIKQDPNVWPFVKMFFTKKLVDD